MSSLGGLITADSSRRTHHLAVSSPGGLITRRTHHSACSSQPKNLVYHASICLNNYQVHTGCPTQSYLKQVVTYAFKHKFECICNYLLHMHSNWCLNAYVFKHQFEWGTLYPTNKIGGWISGSYLASYKLVICSFKIIAKNVWRRLSEVWTTGWTVELIHLSGSVYMLLLQIYYP